MSFNLDNYQPTDIDNTEALVQWLRETRIDEIECLLPDVNGMMRGKIVPCADFIQSLDTDGCLLYTSPSPRDRPKSRMPSSA